MTAHTPVAKGNEQTCLDCKVLPPFSIILCPLHAAARELLEALELAEAQLSELDDSPLATPKVLARVRAAIAKAKGESNG